MVVVVVVVVMGVVVGVTMVLGIELEVKVVLLFVGLVLPVELNIIINIVIPPAVSTEKNMMSASHHRIIHFPSLSCPEKHALIKTYITLVHLCLTYPCSQIW